MLNVIKAELDNSDYWDDTYLNYCIDGSFLDEKLDELHPELSLKGLIPTLLGMNIREENQIVWDRINPSINEKTRCPILMCPDDCDFSCIIVIAEIENLGTSIAWNIIGVDITRDNKAHHIGEKVKWFDKVSRFVFDSSDYYSMLDKFADNLPDCIDLDVKFLINRR